MPQTAQLLLFPWNSFYVIAGTAAAALTGLQFIVIVLGAEARIGAEGATDAFGTPTVVHFCAVLLFSAVFSAPWHSLAMVAWTLGACALAGFAYTLVVLQRARRQTDYEPVPEDWIWHAALPLIAYGVLVGAALALAADPEHTLFVVGACALLLLFIGIHNAWDSVTYVAARRRSEADGRARNPPSSST